MRMLRTAIPLLIVFAVYSILSAPRSFAGDQKPVALWVNKKCVSGVKDESALVCKGIPYIDMTSFRDLLGLAITVEGDRLSLRQGELFSTFTVGQTAFQSMGFTLNMDVPPVYLNNRIYLPLEVVNRVTEYTGVYYEDIGRVNIYTKENKLVAVFLELRRDREVAVVSLKQPVRYKWCSLKNPDRIVLDLEGVKEGQPVLSVPSTHPYLKGIRTGRFKPGILRVVFDLKIPLGFKVVSPADAPTNLEVHFYNILSGIKVAKEDDYTKVKIFATGHGEVKVDHQQKPGRIVLDFTETTLMTGKPKFAGDRQFVRDIKAVQISPEIIRVTAELISPVPWRLASPDETADKSWEIIFARPLKLVTWEEKEGDCFLRIAGEARLKPKFRLEHDPERLQIHLPDSYYTGEAPLASGTAIKSISVEQNENHTVRVGLEMECYTGHAVEFSEDGRHFILRLQRSSITGKLIVVDPGHGGTDPGTTEGILGLREKDINLEVALKLAGFLRKAGARVEMTRTDDSYIKNYDRAYLANDLGADLFVSVHTNSMGSNPRHSDHKGVLVVYCSGKPECKRLAQLVQEEMVSWMERPDKKFIVEDLFVVTRETKMPSVIAEIGFLSNREDEALLFTAEYRTRAAEALYRGILRFFRNEISEMYNPGIKNIPLP
ncbi:MAG: N-acetylmuramoyl-L-alanine amidase [Bacillota bacterium]